MALYAFELGRKKDLCFAELIAVLKQKNLIERSLDTAIFSIDLESPQKLQNSLGGTIKIIEIFEKVPLDSREKQIFPSIQKELEKIFKNRSGKIPFSINILNFKGSQKINIKQLLNFSKKFLKSLNLNSRFVNKNFKNTKPATIYKAKVIQKGIDICIIKGQKELFLGKTVAIQDIDSYSKRDYGKPKRDAKIGMLPPKLAQIMINLAGKTQTIYDPFCGTGTILTEGLLMEKDVIGSDISQRMVEYTKENCQWLEQEFRTKSSWRAFQCDAQQLNKKFVPEKIDAIITEGYLGKPQTKPPSSEIRQNIFKELSGLYLNWLKAANKITDKIVTCLPAIKTQKGLEHIQNFPQIAQQAGYKIKDRFTYDRPDQIVARDILILEKD